MFHNQRFLPQIFIILAKTLDNVKVQKFTPTRAKKREKKRKNIPKAIQQNSQQKRRITRYIKCNFSTKPFVGNFESFISVCGDDCSFQGKLTRKFFQLHVCYTFREPNSIFSLCLII
uniref:(northern house mosquito) hypothetical protein n=1 Tax=Culex pipiens TaxID=7175 RepID=A0A8D8AAR4_CULPI